MGHVINLVVQDVAHNIPECQNFMSLIRDLITLITPQNDWLGFRISKVQMGRLCALCARRTGH